MNKLFSVARQFQLKLAGIIDVRQNMRVVNQIVSYAEEFYKKNIGALTAKKKIGTYIFDFRNQPVHLDVYGIFKENQNFFASFEREKNGQDNYAVIFNFAHIIYNNTIQFYNELTQKLYHELTHYFDTLYDPKSEYQFAPGEYQNYEQPSFYDVFEKQYIDGTFNFGADYNTLVQQGLSVEDISKLRLNKIIKSSNFKKLLSDFNLSLNEEVRAKLYKIIYYTALSDAEAYKEDYFFGMEKSPEEINLGHRMYFNSDAEMKAYINEIIQEIMNYTSRGQGIKLYSALGSGDVSLSQAIGHLLLQSPTYQDIKEHLSDKNIKKIVQEVARYLSRMWSRLDKYQVFAKATGIELTNSEKLHYRYLLQLYRKHDEKLNPLLENDTYINKHQNSVRMFLYHIDMTNKIGNALSRLSPIQ